MTSGSPSEPYLEIERTWDVADVVDVPDWSALPGVVVVDAPERRDLDAHYFDTADIALARSRVALRHRIGGPDAGWHVKATVDGGRHEWSFPLTALDDVESPVLPDGAADVLSPYADGPFTPLARIRNRRTAVALRDGAGALVAEFVDDRVEATAVRTGVVTTWREWELELGPAAPADPSDFFAAADAVAHAAGAAPASSDSKLARALGA